MTTKLRDFKKALEKTIKETVRELTGRQNMSQLGQSIVKDMQKRIKLGYGARRTGGKREKLKALSPSYVEQRRNKLGFWTSSSGAKIPIPTKDISRKQAKKNRAFLKQYNPKLSSSTSPKKSNLHQTGKMVKSIGFLYTNKRLLLGFKTGKSGRKAAFVSVQRPFFFMTNTEEKRATRFIQKRFNQIMARIIRKNF